jgi:UDP-N-acetylmuramoyl-tripeptide--D-alanyl-D-alanine ligase
MEVGGTRFTIEGEFGSAEVHLTIPGRHMVGNALLAVAAGVLCGIPIGECAAALEGVSLTGGRLTRKEFKGSVILDDTYNANPESMIAALETLTVSGGRRIAVLGRMGELGMHAADAYVRVGATAAETSDILICVGEEASAIGEAASRAGHPDVRRAADAAEAAALLSLLLGPGTNVLVKASRSARLEEVIQRLT